MPVRPRTPAREIAATSSPLHPLPPLRAPRPPRQSPQGQKGIWLHRDSQGDEDHPGHGSVRATEGHSGHRQAQHESVVVGTADKDDQESRVGAGHEHGRVRVPSSDRDDPSDAPGAEDESENGRQPPALRRHPRSSARDLDEESREVESTRAVQRRAGGPFVVHPERPDRNGPSNEAGR